MRGSVKNSSGKEWVTARAAADGFWGWAGEDGRALRDIPPMPQRQRRGMDGAPGFVASRGEQQIPPLRF